MRYLLMIYDGESGQPSAGHISWLREMTDRGMFITGARLMPVATATTVQVRSGETLISEAPAMELIGGFVLLDCADLEEAIAAAAKHPVAAHGKVEIRALFTGG